MYVPVEEYATEDRLRRALTEANAEKAVLEAQLSARKGAPAQPAPDPEGMSMTIRDEYGDAGSASAEIEQLRAELAAEKEKVRQLSAERPSPAEITHRINAISEESTSEEDFLRRMAAEGLVARS